MAYLITSTLANRTGLSEDIVQQVLDALRDETIEQNAVGEKVSVRGLFTAKPVLYRQLTTKGIISGFSTKIVPSKTLVNAIEKASLSPKNLTKAKENAQTMEQAMEAAGIAVMEIPVLS